MDRVSTSACSPSMNHRYLQPLDLSSSLLQSPLRNSIFHRTKPGYVGNRETIGSISTRSPSASNSMYSTFRATVGCPTSSPDLPPVYGPPPGLHREDASETEVPITTFMVRDLPVKYTRDMVLDEIRERGLLQDLDFFYLPIDVRRKRSAGYCFVNLTTAEAANRFKAAFDGVKLTRVENNNTCSVALGNVQGLQANIDAYRGSPVMKLSDAYQPLLFENGVSWPLRLGQNKRTGTKSGHSLQRSITQVYLDNPETTLMLHGIPHQYTKEMMLEELQERKLIYDINFFYLPIDPRSQCNMGHCYVNLTSTESVCRFFLEFEGASLAQAENETCQVMLNDVQGQQANIERYQNTSVALMREVYQPALLVGGEVRPFPSRLSLQKLIANDTSRATCQYRPSF